MALECAMEWLTPPDAAALAVASSDMAAAVRKLTEDRVSDAAQGKEAFPVPVLNSVDECRYPYFEYSPVSVPRRRSTQHSFRWGSSGNNPASPTSLDVGMFDGGGCSCIKCQGLPTSPSPKRIRTEDECSICPCGRTVFGDPLYDRDSKLWCLIRGPRDNLPLIYECGPACSCDSSCANRVSQRGLSVKLQVVRHERKGWSLHTAQDIKQGEFVCEYTGELLTNEEARRRHQEYDRETKSSSALLIVREHLPSRQACLRLNIDATRVGNIARFLNHSCDGGNLFSCLVRSPGSCIPRLVFYASENIDSGAELTFSYGCVENPRHATRPCYCGAPACRGFLPSEAT